MVSRYIVLFAFLFFGLSAFAQKDTTMSLWPNGNKRFEKIGTNSDSIRESIMYYDSGKIAMREKYVNNKLTDSIFLDPNGNPTERNKIETLPEYPGGLNKFYMMINRKLRYRADARKNHIEGTIRLSFTISEDGVLENIKVIKGLFPSLDEEAVRVLKLSPKWKPGTFLGEPISRTWHIPIKISK